MNNRDKVQDEILESLGIIEKSLDSEDLTEKIEEDADEIDAEDKKKGHEDDESEDEEAEEHKKEKMKEGIEALKEKDEYMSELKALTISCKAFIDSVKGNSQKEAAGLLPIMKKRIDKLIKMS